VLQGKSDIVSLIAAHTALKEKTQAEVARKGASAMQMAQAPKVKDKDLAMAQGLGATPADVDVPMGGIVGGEGTFGTGAAGGGSVVAFQSGGFSDYLAEQNRNLGMDQARRKMAGRSTYGYADTPAGYEAARKARTAATKPAPGILGRLGRFALSPFAAGLGLMTSTDDLNVGEQEYLDVIKKLTDMGYPPDMIAAMSGEQRMAAAQGKLPAGQADTGGVPTQTLAGLEAAKAEIDKEKAAKAEVAEAGAGGANNQGPGPGGIAQTFAQMMDFSKRVTGQVMSDAEPTKKASDVMADFNKTLTDAGYDFNLLSKQMGDVAKEKEELKGDKKEAMNLRLLEAGLGILGGESPYAFVNIGKGATPAMQGLAKDIKEIQKRRKEYDKETRQLQLMQNQMAEGRGKYTFETLEKQKADQRRAKEREQTATLSMFTSLMQNQNALQIARIGAAREGDISREISRMPGNTRMEQLQNYAKASTKKTDPAEAAYVKTLESYATEDPGGRKLERLKESNPALYARIKRDLATFGLSTGMLTEKPSTGPIRD